MLTLRDLGPEAPQVAAALHARCFDRPWDAAAFAQFLADPAILAPAVMEIGGLAGLALGRIASDEAEILTICTDPAARRQGLGARLLAAVKDGALKAGAKRLFLEVAEDNAAALILYNKAGFSLVGRRKYYYRREGGPDIDALVLNSSIN